MNIWRRLNFAIIASALLLLVLGVATPAQDLTWDPSVIRGKLDNGLEYFIKENKKPEQRVELRLAVKSGSINETDEEQGIAHFTEHMGFNGTEHFAAGESIDYFESIGSEFGPDTNAYTWFDHTMYMLSLPTDTEEPLEKGLITMLDYAGGMLFLPEEVKKERGVVLEELRLGRDLSTRFWDQAMAMVLKDSKYQDRLPIGKKEKIDKFTSELFKTFYGRTYRADRMAFVVVGDIDAKSVEAQIKETFNQLDKPADSEPLKLYPHEPHEQPYAGIITDPEMYLSEVLVMFTRDPSSVRTQGDFRQKIIDKLATGIYNSRLNELTLQENPPFKTASFMDDWRMMGVEVLVADATTEKEKEKAGLMALLTEIERIRRHGILQVELDEQISNTSEFLRKMAVEKDKLDSAMLANNLADSYLYKDISPGVVATRDLFEQIKDGITVQEVQAAVEHIFEPVNMTALFFLPDEQKSMYQDQDLLDVIAQARTEDVAAYERKAAEKSTDYDALVPGEIVKREHIDTVDAEYVTFSNGLRVLVKSTDFKEDEIVFDSFAPGGVLLESYADIGLTKLAVNAWLQGGTKDLTSVEIDRLMSGKTIKIRANGRENFSLSGSTVNKDFEETLQWLRDYLTMPGYRKEGVAKARAMIEDEINGLNADQTGLFNMKFSELMCPGNPIAYTPTVEQIKAIPEQALFAMHQACTAPGNMEMVFVGNLDVEKTLGLIAKYLGSIPERNVVPVPEGMRVCRLPVGHTRTVIYKGNEPRTEIAVMLPGIPMDHPDLPALRVMSKVVDTRMLKKLREEMGGTYYTYLYPAHNTYINGRNYLFGGIATDPDRVEEMMTTMYQIFEDLIKEGPTPEEMNAAKQVAAKDHEEELKENSYWAAIMAWKPAAGMPLDIELSQTDAVQSVTPEQVVEVAKKYLHSDNIVELIALPESVEEEAAE